MPSDFARRSTGISFTGASRAPDRGRGSRLNGLWYPCPRGCEYGTGCTVVLCGGFGYHSRGGGENALGPPRLVCGVWVRGVCVRVYALTGIHTYMCAHIHAHIRAYIHTCIHTYVHTYIHAYIHTYIHTYIRTRVRTYIQLFHSSQFVLEETGRAQPLSFARRSSNLLCMIS